MAGELLHTHATLLNMISIIFQRSEACKECDEIPLHGQQHDVNTQENSAVKVEKQANIAMEFIPHFYIVKLDCAWVYLFKRLFFLFLIQRFLSMGTCSTHLTKAILTCSTHNIGYSKNNHL